jgi:RHS repeat-associated protein
MPFDNIRLKEEIVLSQAARKTSPDPAKYGLSRANTYFVEAMEFLLTPANINVFARRPNGKTPIRRDNNFGFYGDDPIEFEDADSTLHFFFPKDYAYAAADSVTDFSNRVSLRRYFYSDRGKDYMLVGVPWSWIDSAPAGDLIIDPTTNAATSVDVRLYDDNNYGNDSRLAVGKFPNTNNYKTRTLLKFDLSGISSGATVLRATMNLKYFEAVNYGGGTWVDRWVQAHELLQLNFDEQYASRENRTIDIPWYTPYAAINDFDAKATMESTVLFWQSELSELPKWKSWDLTALTQKWLNTPASNYGVILWATNEDVAGYTMRFHSSEATNSSDRPYLEVVWSNTPKTVYFLKDHLGSIRATVLDSATAPVIGYDDYDPWGYPLALRTKAIPNAYLQGASKNKFTGKEYDDEFGLNVYHFDWRPYDPLIGRWWVHDPVDDYYSPYVYVRNNPVRFFDADGKSTVTDSSGKVIHVNTEDKDLSVYRTRTVTGGTNELGIEGGQMSVKEKVGETEFIDEFEEGNELDFSRGPIDDEIEALQLNYVIGGDPASVAFNSLPGKLLDVKANSFDSRKGFLYDGFWVTGRSVGNRLAGKNAAILGKSYVETIAVAGLLHMVSSREIGSLKYLGEIPYAGRQIQSGYKSITGAVILNLWNKKYGR